MSSDFEINKRIKTLRKSMAITPSEMSCLLGIKVSDYSKIEKNGVITAEILKKLAEILETDAVFLLYGETEPSCYLDTERICTMINRQLDGAFHQRYCFLDNVPDSELRLLKIIFSLNKAQRLKVFKYANKMSIKKLP